MKKDQDKRNKHHASESNPEKSFEAGKKGGGVPATPVTNQMNVNNPKNQGSSNSLGESYSRVDRQKRPK